jgi:hypothetical protein
MSDAVTRREFVAVTALAAGPASAAVLPTRHFGKTGLTPSLIAIGCGNRLYMGYKKPEDAEAAVRLALDSGITYLDTAQAYGGGLSETIVGRAAKDRRQSLVLATKTPARTADDVMRRFEASLRNLQTDYVDVLHIHSLKFEDDLKQIEAKGGALEALYKLRDQKAARFIGITSHVDPATLATALERHDFDCTQMALNAGLQGRSPDGAGFWKKTEDLFGDALPPRPFPGASFQDLALPVAVRKKLGIVAMKVTGQDGLIGEGPGLAGAHDLIRYALSLPVSVVTIGMPKLSHIRENTDFARRFQPMSKKAMREFSTRIAGANKLALDRRFLDHVDA